jgi:hypothetical protein
MSESHRTKPVRLPKTLIARMTRDGFTENLGYYLEEIYDERPRKYEDGQIIG